MMSLPKVNAWIYLNDDHPSGTTYDDPTSCYQRLIKQNVYQSVDLLSMCFVETAATDSDTIPAGNGTSHTLRMGASAHNQPYMENIIRDAKRNNPNIVLGVTLVWGQGDMLSNIFNHTGSTDKQDAEKFAANLVLYLAHYGLNEFCLDWEPPLSSVTTSAQLILLCDAIGAEFRKQSEPYYLTLAPSVLGTIDSSTADAINANVSWITPQLYYSTGIPAQFTAVGITKVPFSYGWSSEAQMTGKEAFDDNAANYKYEQYNTWRLNSGNYEFEQDQQKDLYARVYPVVGDDSC